MYLFTLKILSLALSCFYLLFFWMDFLFLMWIISTNYIIFQKCTKRVLSYDCCIHKVRNQMSRCEEEKKYQKKSQWVVARSHEKIARRTKNIKIKKYLPCGANKASDKLLWLILLLFFFFLLFFTERILIHAKRVLFLHPLSTRAHKQLNVENWTEK